MYASDLTINFSVQMYNMYVYFYIHEVYDVCMYVCMYV